MISLHNVNVSFHGQAVLQDLSATIPTDRNTVIYGASGSGKTTLLRVLLGLQKADSGEITGSGGIRFSPVFQEDRLLPWLSAQENVALVSDMTTAGNLLQKLGLADAMTERPAQLSGGMKRRVAIARALAFRGDVLLLDEPFNGLDASAKAMTAATILEANLPIILVTHSRDEASLLRADTEIML